MGQNGAKMAEKNGVAGFPATSGRRRRELRRARGRRRVERTRARVGGAWTRATSGAWGRVPRQKIILKI